MFIYNDINFELQRTFSPIEKSDRLKKKGKCDTK